MKRVSCGFGCVREKVASSQRWRAFHSKATLLMNGNLSVMFQPIGNAGHSLSLDLFPRFCFFLVTDGMSEPSLDLERDVELLRRIAGGDRAAFASFYDQYSGLLFSIAVKVLNDAKEAEDVLQEVFMQIWDKASAYDPLLGKPTSWAVTLTRNKAIDRIRAAQRRSKLIEQATVEASVAPNNYPSANEKLHGKENAQMIRSVVAELPPDQRRAIEMAFFSGLTQDEISKKLQEPLGTIKARIRRGMLKLREKLEGFV
jgi:RNA polymerase sigma-70 factor (ECF subfamily)